MPWISDSTAVARRPNGARAGRQKAASSRAAKVSPLIEAGNVYLPHPMFMPWAVFLEECAAFPNGAHDDQVDAMTQVILGWRMAPDETIVYLREIEEISPI